MAFKAKYNSNWSLGKVVTRLATTLISLWVGGVIVRTVLSAMNGSTSPFYAGLKLIGTTVGTYNNTDGLTVANTLHIGNTDGAGVLSIIGLIGIATVVLEFVNFQM